jgi:hypothetical protein
LNKTDRPGVGHFDGFVDVDLGFDCDLDIVSIQLPDYRKIMREFWEDYLVF